jgi:hypothetical protein
MEYEYGGPVVDRPMGSYRRYSAYLTPDPISPSPPSSPKYKSRFTEHVSTAYTAPPPDRVLYPSSPSPKNTTQKGSIRPIIRHKHSRSVESLESTSSSSSNASFRKIKEFISDTSAKFKRTKSKEFTPEEYYIKGSDRRFTKDDIKFGRLRSTTNYYI